MDNIRINKSMLENAKVSAQHEDLAKVLKYALKHFRYSVLEIRYIENDGANACILLKRQLKKDEREQYAAIARRNSESGKNEFGLYTGLDLSLVDEDDDLD